MRGYWYSKVLRTGTAIRISEDTDTVYIVRTVLRITRGSKSVVGKDVELHLTVAGARVFAKQILDAADTAERTNHDAGYRI